MAYPTEAMAPISQAPMVEEMLYGTAGILPNDECAYHILFISDSFIEGRETCIMARSCVA